MTTDVGAVLGALDRINAEDPRRAPLDGKEVPSEIAHAERLTRWVLKLDPAASPALRVAARGQHVGRWKSPREKYPMDRGGYLRWREDLKKMHADTVAGVLKNAGHDEAFIERVRSLILKKNIKTDPDAQTLEDGLCLVFLETQFDDLKSKTPDDKMREIVRKTWKKMSDKGHAAALALPFTPAQKTFLQETLSA